MNEYGMNEFEMVKKADVMRVINEENAVVLNNLKERSTDEVLCAIASQINGLQTTAKSSEADIDRAAIMRLCNGIEMIIVTVCNTRYTLQPGDEEAIMERTKAIKKELTGDAETD